MKIIHVDNKSNNAFYDGSINHPYHTVNNALENVDKDCELIIHSGVYEPFVVKEKSNLIIRSADNERATIKGIFDEEAITLYVENSDNLTIDNLEVIGGGLGIYVVSTPAIGNKALENITISNCLVHGIRGMHGIAVYAKNDLAPIKNLTMKNCEVYDCRLDSSESTVFNGNIDGFTICNNVVHDNNNIGIDMIGFEGKAKHTDPSFENEYDVDYVRNGKCFNNFVYNISAFDNEAYYENPLASIKEDTKGEYNLCANGIYVDGGQDIEIYDNFMYNCDIGLEVATEHSPDDNPIFKVSGVSVHDNVVCSCAGNSGLAFGGYDYNLGFTENCNFSNNTFIDCNAGMLIQRSKNNIIENNIIADGNCGFLFNHEVLIQDQVNNFKNNVFCTDKTVEDYFDLDGKDINYLMNNSFTSQVFESDRNKVLDDCISKLENIGSRYNPNQDQVDSYRKYLNIGIPGAKKAEEFIYNNLSNIDIKGIDNIYKYINSILKDNDLTKASVELIKSDNNDLLCNLRNKTNGDVDISKIVASNIKAQFHLRYEYEPNTYAHIWIKDININCA